jgi:hypothetical protein
MNTVKFQIHFDTQIGGTKVHEGDSVVATERRDGLWDVEIENIKLGYSLTTEGINILAGQHLAGVPA